MAVTSPIQLTALKGVDTRRAVSLILVGSLAAVLALVLVIYGHGRAASPAPWVASLPALNALLNALSAVFLVRAYRRRRSDVVAHARNMLVALGMSGLFLVSYVTYHALHGDSKFAGQGAIRPVYFVILVSHIVLSAVVLPLIFSSFFFALSGRITLHRKVARYTFPMWLYVSVTGVLVFALLRAYA